MAITLLALPRETTDAEKRKGVETELGNARRDILQRNEDRVALKRDLAKLDRQDAFELKT